MIDQQLLPGEDAATPVALGDGLREVIDACRRAERALRLAARTQCSKISKHLLSYAHQSRAAARELERLLQALGEEPRAETFHDRAAIDWRRLSALTQPEDRGVWLATLAEIESELLAAYDRVLDRPLPRRIRTKLARQRRARSHIRRIFGDRQGNDGACEQQAGA